MTIPFRRDQELIIAINRVAPSPKKRVTAPADKKKEDYPTILARKEQLENAAVDGESLHVCSVLEAVTERSFDDVGR